MIGAAGEVRIRGLRELQSSLKKVNKEVAKTVRDELKEAAEPVRQTAERFAGAEISHIGPSWGQMRLGVTSSTVYIAPKSRRRGGSPRKNLAILLLEKAMFPALEEHQGYIIKRVERALDRLGESEGF